MPRHRDLPKLVRDAEAGGKGVNVLLSQEETYAEIAPVRLDKNGVSAYIAIMRGCNNFCSYCVVPYTRGRERSRDAQTIIAEARTLFENGYREVTLLGQNVNSYRGEDMDFPALLKAVAEISPLLRVRFATSHPKDMSDQLLEVMASMPNICKAIHLPAQSGSTVMLERMNRKYTREWYLDRIAAIRRYMPDCAITTDLIAGFAGETEEDFTQSLNFMEEIGFEKVHVFPYSVRKGTRAEKLPHHLDKKVKEERAKIMAEKAEEIRREFFRQQVGKSFSVIFEAKTEDGYLTGHTANYIPVKAKLPIELQGEMVDVVITEVGDGDFCLGIRN